jgi:hypothetical protein
LKVIVVVPDPLETTDLDSTQGKPLRLTNFIVAIINPKLMLDSCNN